MERRSEEFDIAIDGLDGFSLAMARNLLDAAGIPSLGDGPDFDVAELGRAAHDQIRGSKLLVPKGAGERAKEILREAWGDELIPPGGGAATKEE